MKQIDLSIILPTYNESENIIEILKTIPNYLPQNMMSEVVVVDDNSPDGTAQLAQKYANNIS
ncbi:MAG: glycosyltransferase, partial [Nitrosopumilaceae archaeon]|nr:glycosyltransferase [Nitrosopumilaceae archaeon]